MYIEKGTKKDLEGLHYLLTKLVQDEVQYDNNLNKDFIVETYYERFIELPNSFCLVVKEENKYLGYIFGLIKQEPNLEIARIAKLDALYLEEEIRGKKISDILIKEFKEWAIKNNCKYIDLKVCTNNYKAISLYKKHGLEENKKHMRLEL